MNNSKPSFTKGPRQVRRAINGYIVETETQLIATCACKADAALIAAAPEMYNALESILNNDRLMNALPRADRDLLRAALAKARGES